MKLIQVFNYDQLNTLFPDGVKVFEIREGKSSFGKVIIREFIESQIVSFNITEPLNDDEYMELFEEIINLVKRFGSKLLLHYALVPNPFTDFLEARGGMVIKRVEMSLDLEKYIPYDTIMPKDIELAPFLLSPIKEKIGICFDSIPTYDRFIFSSYSPSDLSELYTFLYTGREGIFIPEFSMNLYYRKELIGFIMVNIFSQNKLTISDIIVFSPFQGRGFGKLLLNESLRRMRRKGRKAIFLSVTKRNKRALNMYTEFGFERIRDYLVYILELG